MSKSAERLVRIPVAEDGEWLAGTFDASPGRPLVVYLHGLGSTRAGDKATFFQRRCRAAELGFCSFDFRGHGESSGEMVEVSLSRAIDDLMAVLGWLARQPDGGSRWILMGSSFGGLTSLWCVRAAVREVRRRIAATLLIAPAIGLERLFSERLGADGVAGWRKRGRLEVPSELGSLELGYDFYRDFSRYPSSELAAGFDLPTLIFQGARDETVAWRPVSEFAAQARQVELHLFSDGDHRLLGHIDTLWEVSRAFLGSRRLI